MIMNLQHRNTKSALVAMAIFLGASAAAADKASIGLVLTAWRPAVAHKSSVAGDECPGGYQYTNRQNWEAQYSTEVERAEAIKNTVHLGPNSPGGSVPDLFFQNRGPNGTSVAYNPTLVEDKLPMRLVQSNIGIGLNLDGEEAGEGTEVSRPHENFVSPEGEPGIDNELYRILGCLAGWRDSGFNVGYHKTQFEQISLNRILINITDVDDEMNDDYVEVAMYKGVDLIPVDAYGNSIPWFPQRIDVRFPGYVSNTTGKIVDGVLTTEAVDHRMSLYQMNAEGERFIRGMQLKLELSETGATGLLAGYENLREWWRSYMTSYTDVVDSVGLWSPPSFYAAAHRLADGYPDPETGKYTAISAAYEVTAVKAYIVEPGPNDPLRTDPNMAVGLMTIAASAASVENQ